jgi:hypothetical protein
MRIKKNQIKMLKVFGIGLVVLLLGMWLAMTLATELFKHREQTLDFVAGVNSIKHWFILMRLSLYVSVYFTWRYILTWLKPDISEETIVYGRRMLVRLFIAYELLFGINIINWITH